MLYTLSYQKRCGDTVVITRSDSLLKLLKIKFVTERNRGPALVLDIRDDDGYTRNMIDLGSSDYWDFRHFCDRVYGGKYYRSYNYIGKCL